jgi:hypothetical protein
MGAAFFDESGVCAWWKFPQENPRLCLGFSCASTAQGIEGVDAPQGHPDAPQARPSPAKPGRREAADAPRIFLFLVAQVRQIMDALRAGIALVVQP